MTRNRNQNREVKPSKFKTTLCQFHLKGEGCPFGEKCAFAHGEDELRQECENVTAVVVAQRRSSGLSLSITSSSSFADLSSPQQYRFNPYDSTVSRCWVNPSPSSMSETSSTT